MVMGPAGTGKSTYCKVIQEHCQNTRRSVHVANLDPAAETFEYDVAFDVRGDGPFLYRVACSVSVADSAKYSCAADLVDHVKFSTRQNFRFGKLRKM